MEMDKRKTKRLSGSGFFLLAISIQETAGQTVPHAHIHIIPRFTNDMENPRGGVRGVIPGKRAY
jgi:diadenosine tetraphosphate (Ap4A) HIT family hydrolase